MSILYKYMSLKEGILMEIRKDTAVFVYEKSDTRLCQYYNI